MVDAPESHPFPKGWNCVQNIEWQQQGLPNTEYNRKYPPDAWGEELAPDARVWKIYRDEQSASDRAMLDTWNKTLDVLLIFAGLFSAVSTAFLIESYKALQPDYTQYIATFLYAAVATRNLTGDMLPPLDAILSPDRFIQTSSIQRWTNGLWFSSLVVSLAVALLSILVKQWLDEYDTHTTFSSPSLKYWARRHHVYHDGLKSWGVPALISFLPLLLHLSLFLFFAGLILFLYPLDGAIAYALAAMVSLILMFYGLSLILPAWRVECPSYTPLLAQARRGISAAIRILLFLAKAPERLFQDTGDSLLGNGLADRLRGLAARAAVRLQAILTRSKQRLAIEAHTIETRGFELDGYTLSTLIMSPSDNDGIPIAFAAIGAVTSERTIDVISLRVSSDLFSWNFAQLYAEITSASVGSAVTAYARCLRAYLVLASRSSWPHRLYLLSVPDLRHSLGVDGLLLAAMAPGYWYRRYFNGDHLICTLQCLLSADISHRTVDRTRAHETCAHPSYLHTLPLRSTCLLFLASLETLPSAIRAMPQFVSCFLLVFCAGFFHQAEEHEIALALRQVSALLRDRCSVNLQSYSGTASSSAYEAINSLSIVLVDYERYSLDLATARILAQHSAWCASAVWPSPVPWSQLSCLSDFIRSARFDECVFSRQIVECYISVMNLVQIEDCNQEQRSHYWTCITVLLKLSCTHALSPGLASVEARQLADKFYIPLTNYDKLDDLSRECALSAFLEGPSAVGTWADASWVDPDDVDPFVYLAYHLSLHLCRRQRLDLPNDAFVRGLFSGSFLFVRFRNLLQRDNIRGQGHWHWIALDAGKHCARLSPTSWLGVIAQLETVGDEGSALRASAVDFAKEMRDSSLPGGELFTECPPNCACTPTAAPPSDAARKPWKDFMTLLRNRTTSAELTV
ncbi:hypothetical protein AURDEDRAFT_166050 [Auricularia subglabra TFB-10046 SS5]|nr:hypothetical protein AURDEDRAFT_166050 [Auricularia subglabra TFB-10046 SS5]